MESRKCGFEIDLKTEKLSMCRICLNEDMGLISIVGTHLQEIYESLVLKPVSNWNIKVCTS